MHCSRPHSNRGLGGSRPGLQCALVGAGQDLPLSVVPWQGRAPMIWRYVLHYPFPLDEDAMREAAARFVGVHDFASLRLRRAPRRRQRASHGARDLFDRVSTLRGQRRTGLYRSRALVLRYMVRKMVGTLLDVAEGNSRRGHRSPVRTEDRSKSGPTVHRKAWSWSKCSTRKPGTSEQGVLSDRSTRRYRGCSVSSGTDNILAVVEIS